MNNRRIGMIAAVSSNGIIGIEGNKMPFSYSEDKKFFRRMTSNSTVIMGRKTFESIGNPLPKRNNIVISSSLKEIPQVTVCKSIPEALNISCDGPIWFIGGASIYEEGMDYVDDIYLTIVPDYVKDNNPVRFPWINTRKFRVADLYVLDKTNDIHVAYYVRDYTDNL